MKSVALTAYPRTATRRSGVKRLRAAGRVPAVIYGRRTKTENLEINQKEMEDLIHHSATENLLLDLVVSGGEATSPRLALVQQVQHHALSGRVLHVDLHEVAADEHVTVMVPVESVGEAVGVKTGGGVLEHVLFKLKVRALPRDLPEVIQVDVTHLEIGQSIHIGDLVPAPGVEILGDKHISVLSVAAPLTEAQEAAAQEAEAAAAGVAADVEMIKERKEGEAAAEEGAPAKTAGAKAAAAKAPAKPAEKKA